MAAGLEDVHDTTRSAGPSAQARCWQVLFRQNAGRSHGSLRGSLEVRGPMATATEVPIAESTEYRPPTQSQKPKAFSGSMPNAATLSSAVDTATKCLATAALAASSPLQRLLTPEAVQKPGAGEARVGQRLQRGEGLGGNDEERGLRIKIFRLLLHQSGRCWRCSAPADPVSHTVAGPRRPSPDQDRIHRSQC